MNMGRIFALKRFEIHDGPGIRTTVFLQGCPLSCQWCHNPEGMHPVPLLSYSAKQCSHCGQCASICSAHHYDSHQHTFLRTECTSCGRCESVCTHNALHLYGKETTVQELLPILLEDRAFYNMPCSNELGGVTISGGEPMAQSAFVLSLLIALKEKKIHTAVDTCGFAREEEYLSILPYTDIFLFDVKAIDPILHKELTGQDNGLILRNLHLLHHHHARVEIRVPYIPTKNACEMESIAGFLSHTCPEYPIKLLPYHNFSVDKYRSLDIKYPMNEVKMPEEEEISSVRKAFINAGLTLIGS